MLGATLVMKVQGAKVSKGLMESVVATESGLKETNFAPMVQDARFWHEGWLASGDVSTKDG